MAVTAAERQRRYRTRQRRGRCVVPIEVDAALIEDALIRRRFLRREDADMPLRDWIDPENFNPGYLLRGMHLLPKRGTKPQWQHTQDYWTEKDAIPAIDLDGPEFVYACAEPAAVAGCRTAASCHGRMR